MASGPSAGAATPHRANPAYQAMIDSGPPTTLEPPTPSQPAKRRRNEQTEPVEWPALQQTGRPQRTPQINRPTGLELSTHAQAQDHGCATAALDTIWSEVQRKQDAKRAVLSMVARSLDSIVASCRNDLKTTAREITELFSTFLTTAVWKDQTPNQPEANPEGRDAPQSRAAATGARPTHGRTEPHTSQRRPMAEDIRILVRVPEDHQEWAKNLTNFALREATCKTLGLLLTDIPDIHHTPTGFAIRPRTKYIQQKILAKEQELGRCLRATKIELPTKWYNYVIPNCPATLSNIYGEQIDISAVINDEVVAQAGAQPVSIRQSKHGINPATNKGSWIASFLAEVPPFRLFGASAYSRLIEKKRPPPARHSPGCQGYHPNRPCVRTPRCENCGKPDPDATHPQPCKEPAKCANCYGPAPASHDGCPAKPARRNGRLVPLTGKELTAIRRTGQKLYDNMCLQDTGQNGRGQDHRTPSEGDEQPATTPRPKGTKRRATGPIGHTDTSSTPMDTEHPDPLTHNQDAGTGPTRPTNAPDPRPQDSQRPRRSTVRRSYADYENQYNYLEDEPTDN